MSADSSCTSISSTIHNTVWILNSKVYQNTAQLGGGIAIIFKQSCFAVLIHNVSLSRNVATKYGGNIYLLNICTAGNTVTISRTTVEFGNASDIGGGFMMQSRADACQSSMLSLKPSNINVIESTFQYNTACNVDGGVAISFGSSEYFGYSAEVNITNVTFCNNTVGIFPLSMHSPTKGGNIFIEDNSGHWVNSVRIHSCVIKGGVAGSGGGIYRTQTIYTGSLQKSARVEGLFISNTQFLCNQVAAKGTGASLVAVGQLGNYNATLHFMSQTITFKRLMITDTIFHGTCASSSNVDIYGLRAIAPYLPTWYSVVFVNVSFQGYSSSPCCTFHSQQFFDLSLDDDFIPTPTTYYTVNSGVMLFFIPNATFIDCEFIESRDTALYGATTNMFFGGSITFRDNIATYGAGLATAR